MPRVVAIIPARDGSKRLPGKNKKLLLGKPLICYTIEQALKCDFIDEIIVTSDDKDILIKVPCRYTSGRLSFQIRPPELAQDDTTADDVARYVTKNMPLDTIIIWLQPTSPLRITSDILFAYNLYSYNEINVISVWVNAENKSYDHNGAVYVFDVGFLWTTGIEDPDKMIICIMPKKRSIDIDTIEDFQEVERLMKERLENE